MLKWALGFLIVALIAAILGFGRIAAEGSDIARICFFLFILGFAIALVRALARRRRIPPRPGA